MIRIIQGDCRDVLPTLPERSVHCVVTSPPYWGLRSYLKAGHPDKPREIGQEKRLDCLDWARGENCGACYICVLRGVFADVWRVLRDDGTLWINQGDSYHNGDKGGYLTERSSKSAMQQSNLANDFTGAANRQPQPGLKPKDLCAQPWRLALALQADGWYWRDEIIWHKRSCMPSSQRDRCTRSHEVVLMFSKQERYFYDIEAIKEPVSQSMLDQIKQGYNGSDTKDFDEAGAQSASGTKANIIARARASWRGSTFDDGKTGEMKHTRGGKIKVPSGWDTGAGSHGAFHRDGREQTPQYRELKPPHGSIEARKSRQSENNKSMPTAERNGIRPAKDQGRVDQGLMPAERIGGGAGWRNDPDARPLTRTKRSVWSLGPEPFKESHFAVFPSKLVEPCIKAGTSERGVCPECGAPWARCIDAEFVPQQDVSDEKGIRGSGDQKPLDDSDGRDGFPRGTTTTTGWSPTCKCGLAETVPATVMDIFGGAGTVGLVADRLQRNAILIELNANYADMAQKRVLGDAPLFAEVS